MFRNRLYGPAMSRAPGGGGKKQKPEGPMANSSLNMLKPCLNTESM